MTENKSKLLKRLTNYASRPWYIALLSLFAALDAYILVIPNEAMLIPAVLANPTQWVISALFLALGSALGAVSFAYLLGIYGNAFLIQHFPKLMQSHTWADSVHILHQHAIWGLALISFSPIPQQAAVAIVGLAHVSTVTVFLSVFAGRAAKYLLISWCTLRSPKLFMKISTFLKLTNGKSDSAS